MAGEASKQAVKKEREESVDKTLRRLPGGLGALESVHDANASEILDLASRLVRDAREKLGPNAAKPRVKRVEALFTDHAGAPRKVPKDLDAELRRPEHVETIAQLDQVWDKAFATAVNAFDQVSVASGSKVQDAHDDWMLAVRIYESESRSASAILKAEIEKAKPRDPTRDDDAHADVEVEYYTQAEAISSALVVYEQVMAKATTNLATAFGALMGGLFTGFTDTAVGEAKLIHATQSAYKSYWTAVKNELDKR